MQFTSLCLSSKKEKKRYGALHFGVLCVSKEDKISFYFSRVGNLFRAKQETAAPVSLVKLTEEFNMQVRKCQQAVNG